MSTTTKVSSNEEAMKLAKDMAKSFLTNIGYVEGPYEDKGFSISKYGEAIKQVYESNRPCVGYLREMKYSEILQEANLCVNAELEYVTDDKFGYKQLSLILLNQLRDRDIMKVIIASAGRSFFMNNFHYLQNDDGIYRLAGQSIINQLAAKLPIVRSMIRSKPSCAKDLGTFMREIMLRAEAELKISKEHSRDRMMALNRAIKYWNGQNKEDAEAILLEYDVYRKELKGFDKIHPIEIGSLTEHFGIQGTLEITQWFSKRYPLSTVKDIEPVDMVREFLNKVWPTLKQKGFIRVHPDLNETQGNLDDVNDVINRIGSTGFHPSHAIKSKN